MRVIAHVDMDAFYTQVEIGRDPDRLAGQPVVVIQYNPFGDLSTLRPDEDRIKPESNGSIIAVSYEARKYGVKRNMMAQQAKKLCPTLQIVQVPVAHGKADLTIYRDAGAAVINVLSKSAICERASIDEAYLDVTAAAQQVLADARKRSMSSSSNGAQGPTGITAAAAPAVAEQAAAAATAEEGSEAAMLQQEEQGEQGEQLGELGGSGLVLPAPESFDGWHVAGVVQEGEDAVRSWWYRPGSAWDQSDALLAAGALVVARARAAVRKVLGYSCSAGIAHSKILAKLGSGLHKPAQQTVVPAAAVAGLLAPLPVSKLRQLGGKFGEEVMAKLNVATVGELAATPVQRLEAALGVQDAAWLHRLAQGKDGEEVKPRTLPKSISCGKTFRGVNVLTGLTAVHKWLLELGQELQERIEADRQQHQRLPKLLTVSFDSAPLDSAAEGVVPTAAAAAAAGAADNGKGSNAGPSHGRLNAQNWRAGATNISRSCALRHARADAIATDALGLVKKWARDRPNGFRIVTMFVSASNFSLAPTGASTLDRFFSAPAGAAAAAAAGSAQPGAPYQSAQQQQQPSATGQPSAAGRATAVKRPAVGRAGPGRASKTARTDIQHGSLRQFLATAPAQAAAAGGVPGPGLAAAGTAEGRQDESTGAAEHATTSRQLSENLKLGYAAGADSDGDDAGGIDIDRVESDIDSEVGVEVWGSQELVDNSDADVDAYADRIDSRVDGAQAGAAAASWGRGLAAVRAAAAAVGAAASADVAADAQATGGQAGPLAVSTAMPVHKQARANPVRSALSVLQFSAAAGAASCKVPGHPQLPAEHAAAAEVSSAQSAQPAPVGMSAAGQPSSAAWADGQAGELLGGMQQQDLGSGQQLPSLHAWLPPDQQQCVDAAAASEQAQFVQRTQLQEKGVAVCAEGQLHAGLAAGGETGPAQQQQGRGQRQGSCAHGPSQCADQYMDQQQDGQQVRFGHKAQQSSPAAHGQASMQEVLHGPPDQQGDLMQAPLQLQELQHLSAHAIGPSRQHPEQQQAGDKQDEQVVQPAQLMGAAWAQQPMQLSDVDPDVLAALPWDIQVEVQQQLRGRTGSRPSSIQAGRRGRGAGRGGAGRRPQQQQHQQQGSIFKWLKK